MKKTFLVSTILAALTGTFASSVAIAADPIPDGKWASTQMIIPRASCHPHCNQNINAGKFYGDPHFFPVTYPDDRRIYMNPRFVGRDGGNGGCALDVPISMSLMPDNRGITVNVYARSKPCPFVVEADVYKPAS
jgi:hypothetical protein